MKVGDLLPKELDLAEKLGVSRTVIREALLRLKTVGLIESKKHKGAVLTNPNVLLPLRKVFHPSILDSATLKDLFEMRLALEVGMADFIVNKITDKDIKELEDIANHIVSGSTASSIKYPGTRCYWNCRSCCSLFSNTCTTAVFWKNQS
jgi:DNA-binding FadR family transcriptional regulator